MSFWFDMTGTMIITSFLYLLGPRGFYIEFRVGAGLVLRRRPVENNPPPPSWALRRVRSDGTVWRFLNHKERARWNTCVLGIMSSLFFISSS